MSTVATNTTTRRYTRGDLRVLADAPDSDVLVLGVGDRFSERKEVGLLVLTHDSARTVGFVLALSCSARARFPSASALRAHLDMSHRGPTLR